MQTITLYRYARQDGGVTVSPTMPPDGTDYTTRYRLIADDGFALTDGTTVTTCTDADSADGWTEIDAPEEETDQTEIEEKAAAYDIITGVTE